MNARQLKKLGIPAECVPTALSAIRESLAAGELSGVEIESRIQAVSAAPREHLDDTHFSALASELLTYQDLATRKPIAYQTWGADGIDQQSHAQMRNACALPCARGAALMPDAHLGYGLPIGGVLACESAVVPYAVGVDIACRMKLSILDLPCDTMGTKFELFRDSLEEGTRFGVGVQYETPQNHAVMDADWSVTQVTRQNRDKAWRQLGTSGSGNHFVEFGEFSLTTDNAQLGLSAGRYTALLSHSGSRGPGAAVCSTYSRIAQQRLPRPDKQFGKLAWLDIASEAGQEYWAAMNLMGDYAAANHSVIHRRVTQLLGASALASVENHHNFAWKEKHGGRDLYVHRKGATPAGAGVLGVIPGSMSDPAFVVRGKGKPTSFDSASHGAGRVMSRRQAKSTFNFQAVRRDLESKGVRVLSAGADEVPGVYKNILDVMRQQADLVDVIARFDPKIVKMCDDGSRAED